MARETPRALQAFNDYLAMGDGRSLRDLWARYRSGTESPPTRLLSTLGKWSRIYRWQERIAELKQAERAAIVARGIADRQNRIDAYNDRWHRMREVIKARGEAMATVIEGGDTGLLVRQLKKIGQGRDAETVEEYAVDTGLLSAMLAHEKQAAQELGQWEEKSAVTGEHFVRVYERDGNGDGDG